MTHYKPNTQEIKNIEELHTFIKWYFHNVKQLSRPQQILQYIHRNEIKLWTPITNRRLQVILTQHEDYGVDTRVKRRRYYLKGEYGNVGILRGGGSRRGEGNPMA